MSIFRRAVITVIIGFVLTPTAAHQPIAPDKYLTLPSVLIDGDLVFRRGKGALSRLAMSVGSQPRFSHVGVVVRSDSGFLVIHALPGVPGKTDGVVAEPLSVFVASDAADEVAFYRLEGLSDRQRVEVREFLFAALGRAFDYRFSYSDNSTFYCSELVLKAFAAAGRTMASQMSSVRVLSLQEPAYPPDAIWRLPSLRQLGDRHN